MSASDALGATCPVRIERLVVKADRVVCFASFPDPALRESTPKLAARLVARFPALPSHACVNEIGTTFGDVIDATPLPHVLEHLAIDGQVRAEAEGAVAGAPAGFAAPSCVYVGTSEWVDEGAGTARIEVSFADDIVALRALGDAVDALNEELRALDGGA